MSRKKISNYHPELPKNPVFSVKNAKEREIFKNFLLTKLVNGYLTATTCAPLDKMYKRPREVSLADIFETYPPSKPIIKGKSANWCSFINIISSTFFVPIFVFFFLNILENIVDSCLLLFWFVSPWSGKKEKGISEMMHSLKDINSPNQFLFLCFISFYYFFLVLFALYFLVKDIWKKLDIDSLENRIWNWFRNNLVEFWKIFQIENCKIWSEQKSSNQKKNFYELNF